MLRALRCRQSSGGSRNRLGMHLHLTVLLEILGEKKRLAARLTVKVLHLVMRHLVLSLHRSHAKCQAALGALVRPLAGVNRPMHPQFALAGEHPAALIAGILANRVYVGHVPLKQSLCRGAKVAVLALKRTLSRVTPLMHRQAGLPWEDQGALVAPILAD